MWYDPYRPHPRHHKAATAGAAKQTEHVSKDPFGSIPKGQLQIIISINQEQLHLYSDGTEIMHVPVATGLPGHPTPMGAFSIIQKDRYHHSNIYSGAPMPFMQRITWSGVAMHEGVSLGHPASHGCIRMPHDFAARLFQLTKGGERVFIARNELRLVPFADAHLFVHKDPASAAIADPVKTAQTVDTNTKSDAVDPPVSASDPVKADAKTDAKSDSNADTTGAAGDTAQPAAAATNTLVPAAANVPAAGNILRGTADMTAPITAPDEIVPVPLPKPARLAEMSAASNAPIAVFVSRKEKKIFVRQHHTPILAAPITIAHPEQPLGSHVFTAMGYQDDTNTTLRWNVVTLAGETQRTVRTVESGSGRHGRRVREERVETVEAPAPTSPADALARLDIPQDVVQQISELMVPGSSLTISDLGLGPETGEGTDFIVLTH